MTYEPNQTNGNGRYAPQGAIAAGGTSDEQKSRYWAAGLHLSAYLSYIIPIVGMLAPIGIWWFKKDEHPELDDHGKMIINFTISMYIYGTVAGFLASSLAFIVGLPMVIIISLLVIFYPLIAAIVALKDGVLFTCPFLIKIFK